MSEKRLEKEMCWQYYFTVLSLVPRCHSKSASPGSVGIRSQTNLRRFCSPIYIHFWILELPSVLATLLQWVQTMICIKRKSSFLTLEIVWQNNLNLMSTQCLFCSFQTDLLDLITCYHVIEIPYLASGDNWAIFMSSATLTWHFEDIFFFYFKVMKMFSRDTRLA